MQRLASLAGLAGLILLVATSVPGCGQKEPPLHQIVSPAPPRKAPTAREDTRTALEVKSREGVLKGRVVFEGEIPPLETPAKLLAHPDSDTCLKGGPAQSSKQTWYINKENRGLANVVVWLEPPEGKYFALTEQQKNRSGEAVVIDQPYCAFVPHVTSLFPKYFDGKKLVETGQKLVIRNSAPFSHAIQWDPSPENQMVNHTLTSKSEKEFVLNPQKKNLLIGCGLHTWMHGIIWIFDHPYHAVTDADGHFQIKDVPTDVELTFKAWHESQHARPFEQRKMTFKKGENSPVDLKITK